MRWGKGGTPRRRVVNRGGGVFGVFGCLGATTNISPRSLGSLYLVSILGRACFGLLSRPLRTSNPQSLSSKMFICAFFEASDTHARGRLETSPPTDRLLKIEKKKFWEFRDGFYVALYKTII